MVDNVMEHMELNNKNIIELREFNIRHRFCLWLSDIRIEMLVEKPNIYIYQFVFCRV